jgi:hypothetical protein
MDTFPLQALDAEIARLTRELSEAERILAEKQLAVAEISAKLAGFQTFRRSVTAPAGNGKIAHKAVGPTPPAQNTPQKGVTEAIFDLLRAHPQGLETLAVIDGIQDHVQTRAANKRHTIRTTLFNLAKNGKLVKGKTGKYSIPSGED